MPTIGWFEILIAVTIAIIVLGPKDFPIMSSLMGDVAKGIKSFKKGMASDVIDDSEPKNISDENKDSNNKD